jgi:hypothetical protein
LTPFRASSRRHDPYLTAQTSLHVTNALFWGRVVPHAYTDMQSTMDDRHVRRSMLIPVRRWSTKLLIIAKSFGKNLETSPPGTHRRMVLFNGRPA